MNNKKSIKSSKVNNSIRREMSSIIKDELKDPGIYPMTSVTGAEVTKDLKYAKIYISVLGSDKQKKDTLEGLERSKGYARHCLASRLNMRNTPELTYVLDESIEYGAMMSKRIDEVNKNLKEEKDELPD